MRHGHMTWVVGAVMLALTVITVVFGTPPPMVWSPGFNFERYRTARTAAEAEFLLLTVPFAQSEEILNCERVKAEDPRLDCEVAIVRVADVARWAAKIRETMQHRDLRFVQAVISVEGFASVERNTAEYDNMLLAQNRAVHIDARIKEAMPRLSRQLPNFQVKPENKGVYIPHDWKDDFRQLLTGPGNNGRFYNEARGRPDTVDEALEAHDTRCRDGAGLWLPAELQTRLAERLKRKRDFERQLAKGRKVEIWLRTNSLTITNLINPRRLSPCSGSGAAAPRGP